jgi:hypothetical protein
MGVATIGAALLGGAANASDTLATRMPVIIGSMAPLLGLAFLLVLALPVLPLRETAYVTEAAEEPRTIQQIPDDH